ncbi:hypothetical protein F511_16972 [Dorcoceras hygrometricum]|uniref:Uncharacterized protein n=1 Tax=Dorcoceras hygrometricum TaxID=472368 RepID=A0A2Z7AB89_9LAMI|nr:hypothetical protein F511_16972 [Dorcoceras hygrometricum]
MPISSGLLLQADEGIPSPVVDLIDVVYHNLPNREASTCVTLNGSGIQLAVGPQQLRLRKHIFGLTHRIMVKRLTTSSHDPLGITDSACKNQSVMVSVQYDPFNTDIPIRSTTIGKSRVARDPITMHTSWRSNSDIACVIRMLVEDERITPVYLISLLGSVSHYEWSGYLPHLMSWATVAHVQSTQLLLSQLSSCSVNSAVGRSNSAVQLAAQSAISSQQSAVQPAAQSAVSSQLSFWKRSTQL